MNDKLSIIFLDFQGVMSSAEHPGTVNDYHVGYLNQLIESTNAKIVVTSSHRLSGMKSVQKDLKNSGCIGEVIGITPHKPGRDRGFEIELWLRGAQKYNSLKSIEIKDSLFNPNSKVSFEDIGNYIILDDDNIEGHDGHFIKTNFVTGLNAEVAMEAYYMLQRQGA